MRTREEEETILYNRLGVKLNCQTPKLRSIILDAFPKEREEIAKYIVKYRPVVLTHFIEEEIISEEEVVKYVKEDSEVLEKFILKYLKRYPRLFFCFTEEIKQICEKDINFFEKIIKDQYYFEKLREFLIPLLETSKLKYKKNLFDLLPCNARSDERIKKIFNRTIKIYEEDGFDKEGYDNDWKNLNGEVKQFFQLYGGYKIKSKDEYSILIKKYIEESTSIPNFCRRYGLDNEIGFKKLLSRYEEEHIDDNLIKQVNETKQNAQKEYYNYVSDIMKKVIEGSISMEEYLNNYYQKRHDLRLINSVLSKEEYEEFVKKYVEYIEQNPTTLNIYKMNSFFNVETLIGLIEKTMQMCRSINNREINRKTHVCEKIIMRYYKKYHRESTYKSIMTADGNKYVIDDDIIDQTLAYIDNKGLYLCQYVVDSISKKIAMKDIVYKEETEEEKKRLKEKIEKEEAKKDELLELLATKENINDYITSVEEYNKSNKVLIKI